MYKHSSYQKHTHTDSSLQSTLFYQGIALSLSLSSPVSFQTQIDHHRHCISPRRKEANSILILIHRLLCLLPLYLTSSSHLISSLDKTDEKTNLSTTTYPLFPPPTTSESHEFPLLVLLVLLPLPISHIHILIHTPRPSRLPSLESSSGGEGSESEYGHRVRTHTEDTSTVRTNLSASLISFLFFFSTPGKSRRAYTFTIQVLSCFLASLTRRILLRSFDFGSHLTSSSERERECV